LIYAFFSGVNAFANFEENIFFRDVVSIPETNIINYPKVEFSAVLFSTKLFTLKVFGNASAGTLFGKLIGFS
jgi:hypothetical protein